MSAATAEAADSRFGPRFRRWLDRRIPPSREIALGQRNVFIFPTGTGFALAGLLALLIVVAINYQASLIYGVAFLLGGMFTVAILHTFRNLSGLHLEFAGARNGFAGEDIQILVRVARAGAGREGIRIGFPGSAMQWVALTRQEEDRVRLFVPGERRGWLRPGRLLVETRYPLGWLRAWTWIDLNVRALVYPSPLFAALPSAPAPGRDEGQLTDPWGSEEFTDLKPYQPGDSVKHILWRAYARGGELMVKRYASFLEPRLWLDLDEVPGALEERLRRLTGLALQAHRAGRAFGLRLGARVIEPCAGEAHLERVLEELALHGHA